MPAYRPLSLMALVVFTTGSIYFFIQDQDVLARQLAFFAFYAFITIFYLFKSLYYRRHKATFNELFFVVGIPLLPPIFVLLGEITRINSLYFSDILAATITIQGNAIDFSLGFAAILALPYLFFALFLLFRSFIRYEFIRYTAYSKGGPPGTLVGIFLTAAIGIFYLVVSLVMGDLLIGLFGFIYALNGLLAFFA